MALPPYSSIEVYDYKCLINDPQDAYNLLSGSTFYTEHKKYSTTIINIKKNRMKHNYLSCLLGGDFCANFVKQLFFAGEVMKRQMSRKHLGSGSDI